MDIKLNHPPLEKRMNILNEYQKATRLMGFDNASNSYRRSMQSLYERYNPDLVKLRKWQEKKKGYSDY